MTSTRSSLSNPLILRLILLNLPTKDLLLSQRVCKTWHHLIKTSHSIQKLLFLLPEEEKSSSITKKKNDLLSLHFPDFFQGSERHTSRACLGPLDSTRWHHNSHPAYAYSGASWRKMFLSQPPVNELQVLESVSGMAGKRGTFKSMKVKEGVRFDIIYDLVHSFLIPTNEGRIDRGAHVEIVGMREEKVLLPIVRNRLHRSWIESQKARIREVLPDVGFAKEGCVVVYLERTQQCSRGWGVGPGERVYGEDYLRSEAKMKKVKWDVVKQFFVR